MMNITADTQRNDDVEALVDDFICLLDRRNGEAWLSLFTPDGYYVAIREVELEQANNVLIIGEDMKRLKGRIVSGLERDTRRTAHTVSGVRTNSDQSHATATFTVWYDGAPTYAGFYLFDLKRVDGALRIRQCQAVLHGDIVHAPIFLPI